MGNRKRWGDRRDATLVRETDGLHFVMPIIYPGRCNNEAFINLTVDLTETAKYLEYKMPTMRIQISGTHCFT